MTTILGLLLSVSLLSSPNVNAGHQNKHSLGQAERLETNQLSFSALNKTPVNLGVVTINEADQNVAYVNVPGAGTFSTDLTADAVSCVINGQLCSQGQPTWIKINDQVSVRATLTSDIIVVDQQVVR